MIHLRELPVGSRFMLMRTKQKFLKTGISGTKRIAVFDEGQTRFTDLHQSCSVKPIYEWERKGGQQ